MVYEHSAASQLVHRKHTYAACHDELYIAHRTTVIASSGTFLGRDTVDDGASKNNHLSKVFVTGDPSLVHRSQAFVFRTGKRAIVANLVWHEWLHDIPAPIHAPKLSRVRVVESATKQVFGADDVSRMLRDAASVSPYADALIRILFTTGVRIGAVAALQWNQVIHPQHKTVQTMVSVMEKGNRPRVLILPADVRDALDRLYRSRTGGKVFPVSVRQLRNIFYKTCGKAGLQGPHCHPHTARHTVVHHRGSFHVMNERSPHTISLRQGIRSPSSPNLWVIAPFTPPRPTTCGSVLPRYWIAYGFHGSYKGSNA